MKNILSTRQGSAATTSEDRKLNMDWQIEDSIRYYSLEEDDVIKARVNQLNKEWDMDRTLALNVSIASFSGIILSAVLNKKWLILPAVISAFFTQYAISGWGKSSRLFGNHKMRTKDQIDQEKYGLIDLLKNR